jgi:protoheme IX farnesyltransferase
VPTWLGYTGPWYLGGALLTSIAFLAVAAVAARRLTDAGARRLFFASLIYHPVLLGLMLFDTVRL